MRTFIGRPSNTHNAKYYMLQNAEGAGFWLSCSAGFIKSIVFGSTFNSEAEIHAEIKKHKLTLVE